MAEVKPLSSEDFPDNEKNPNPQQQPPKKPEEQPTPKPPETYPDIPVR
jgi:hypothetical protein